MARSRPNTPGASKDGLTISDLLASALRAVGLKPGSSVVTVSENAVLGVRASGLVRVGGECSLHLVHRSTSSGVMGNVRRVARSDGYWTSV